MKHKRWKLPLILISIPLVLALIVFGCQFFLDPHDNRIVEGVTIGGMDVGGMTRREALDALTNTALETVLVEDLTVTLPNGTVSFAPYYLGAQLDVGEAVRTAFRYGRTEDSTVAQIGLLDYMVFDQEAIRTELNAYAKEWNTDLTGFVYSMEGETPDLTTDRSAEEIACQTLNITMGIPTSHLDVEAAFQQVMDKLDNAIGHCQNGTYSITVAVPDSQIPEKPDVEAIYEEFYAEAVNDSLDMETYGFVHGSYGYHFDKEAAAAAVAAAGYGETVSIPMVCIEPEIKGDNVYFRDVLGFCNSPHNTNEKRNHNLKLLCQTLDGVILQPGEEFSYNETLGERTEERGYQAAPGYSGDRLVDVIGGGVCQGSSTLYNCVLMADLEVTFRAGHGAPINYLPLGLDAAVNWGTTDFNFRNNANFPIMLKAEVSDGHVRMKILGTDEKDYYIKLESRTWTEGDIIYANAYRIKFDKETDEQISRERISYNAYRNIG